MSNGELRQVILVGEVLQVRVNDPKDFDEIESYAKATLDKYVRLDSPEAKKQILLSVLVLCSELIKFKKQLELRKDSDQKSDSKLAELLSLVQSTLGNQE